VTVHRNPARKGLSYLDANQHRLVTIESDVLGIKQRILETWPGWFDVYFDEFAESWVIVQHCKDGVDRLFAETDRLDERILQRIHDADQEVRGQEDPLALIDEFNDKLQAENDRVFGEQIQDVAERLVHAFHKDGLINRPRAFIGNTPWTSQP
jgi:hypothetical protein